MATRREKQVTDYERGLEFGRGVLDELADRPGLEKLLALSGARDDR